MPKTIIGLCIINSTGQLLGSIAADERYTSTICSENMWFGLLDILKEREGNRSKYPDAYLGLVSTVDDCLYYAHITNTRIRFILATKEVVSTQKAAVGVIKDSEIRIKCKELVEYYTNLLMDPFYTMDQPIPKHLLRQWILDLRATSS
jgi:hypothetical protein